MEIRFKRDTAFRKQFFVPESFAHPAKMDAQLLIWIVEHYTEAGETILDPMAGMGTTMLACTLGRDVVLVELEEKFCKMMRDNWEQVKMRPQLGSTMGSCKIIQGDARQLEGLLVAPEVTKGTQDVSVLRDESTNQQVDKIVTSPPYAEAVTGKDGIDWTKGEAKRRGGVDGKSNVYLDGFNYGDNPQNIGNLPYGEIDKCIFSPPYSEGLGHQHKKYGRDIEASKSIQAPEYSRSPDNVGNLPYGQIDKIVTSPPYEEAHDKKIGGLTDTDRPDLIPYSWVKSDNEANIGNLKSQSYLEAMLQVYQQCHKVLKPEGLLILVTKNFIRNKQIIRLDEDTIKLCEQAGFSFVERHYRKLPSQSFWRVIYHNKFPDVEQILNEDILIFQKELLNE